MKNEKRIKKENKILEEFISIYCRENHLKQGKEIYKGAYCKECYELLQYALEKNKNCPFDPKPQCKHCKVHCYSKEMRQKMSKVMKFSGIYLIKHGRIGLILHYFF